MYRLIVLFNMQYFWIVCHDMVGTIDKVFLQPQQAIEWGRRKATQNPDFYYRLFKQPITRTGKITFCKILSPFKSQPQKDSEFNWDEFNAKRGADMDIDIIR